ncbi:MSP7-like protein [Plasmodium sp. gorilla clade G2]|uniref:MSP7-like protein n=1 Tax=Plasmodium sp. gorilla clade G2 TaxID=880535 RepID=UPI000D2E9E1E|nr:MSP7-like protein [Plasmodium sp. gorilla clade G2]SOV20113.1 MSP7-like protein [Plasmodium sp. gorilla clade G2]
MKGTIISLSFFIFFMTHFIFCDENAFPEEIFEYDKDLELEKIKEKLKNLNDIIVDKLIEYFQDNIDVLIAIIQELEKEKEYKLAEEKKRGIINNDLLNNKNINKFKGQGFLSSTWKQIKGESEENPSNLQISSKDQTLQSSETNNLNEENPPDQSVTTNSSVVKNTVSNTNTNDANTKSVIKYLDNAYDEILKEMNLSNDADKEIYRSKFDRFKQGFENLVLNQNEYELIKRLILTFSNQDETGSEKKNHIINMLKKALEEEKFSQEFKNFIYGIYAYAKKHNYLKLIDSNKDIYKKVFENATNLLDTLQMKIKTVP